MSILRSLALGAVLSVSAIGAAQATIVDNGDTTIDTASGLEWLDVTKTVNMSYNNV